MMTPIPIPHSYAFMTGFLQDNEPSIGHPNPHQHPINLLRIKKFLKTPPHSQLPPLTPTQSSIMLFVDSNIKEISATSPLPHTFPYRSFTSTFSFPARFNSLSFPSPNLVSHPLKGTSPPLMQSVNTNPPHYPLLIFNHNLLLFPSIPHLHRWFLPWPTHSFPGQPLRMECLLR